MHSDWSKYHYGYLLFLFQKVKSNVLWMGTESNTLSTNIKSDHFFKDQRRARIERMKKCRIKLFWFERATEEYMRVYLDFL